MLINIKILSNTNRLGEKVYMTYEGKCSKMSHYFIFTWALLKADKSIRYLQKNNYLHIYNAIAKKILIYY